MAILPDTTKPSYEELVAMLAQKQADLAALKASQAGKLTLKVSDKGALSLCGLQRFPVTLYASQWERILEAAPQIKSFIAANASTLSRKPTP